MQNSMNFDQEISSMYTLDLIFTTEFNNFVWSRSRIWRRYTKCSFTNKWSTLLFAEQTTKVFLTRSKHLAITILKNLLSKWCSYWNEVMMWCLHQMWWLPLSVMAAITLNIWWKTIPYCFECPHVLGTQHIFITNINMNTKESSLTN